MDVDTATHVTYVRLDDLRPHEGNPKLHDVEHLIDLIDRLGFIGTIQVDDRTERVLGGHGRWHALVQMRAGGYRIPAGILLDDDGQWLVPITRGWASRDDREADAANLALNRAQELGGYDERALSRMLEEVHAYDVGLFESLAYSVDELDALVKHATGSDAPDEGTQVRPDVDDADLGGDGMTDVPDSPKHEKVHCPSCGHYFRPGDKEVW